MLTFSPSTKIEKRLSILFFVLDYINTRFVKPELNVHAKEQQTSLSLSRLLLVAKRKSRVAKKKHAKHVDPLVTDATRRSRVVFFFLAFWVLTFFFALFLGSPLSWDSRHFSVLLMMEDMMVKRIKKR